MSIPQTETDAASDAELLEGWAVRHDSACLGVLIQRYNSLVLGVCLRQCRCRADVEDAFQATFLQLSRSADKIKNPASLPAWLHAVAYRVAVRTRRMYENSQSETIDIPVEDQPFQQIASRHDLQLLDEELNKLPAHCRQAVVLFHLEGLSIGEIAQHTNSTIGAVRGLLQRSRVRLRSRLLRRGVNLSAALTAISLLPFDAVNAAEVTAKTLLLCQHASNANLTSTDSPTPPQTQNQIQHLDTLLQPSGISSMSTLTFGIGSATASLMFLLSMLPWQQPESPASKGSPATLTIAAQQTSADAPFPVSVISTSEGDSQTAAKQMGAIAKYDPSKSNQLIEDQINEVLEQPTKLKIPKIELSQFAELIRSSTDLPVYVDDQGLSAAGIDTSIELSVMVPGSSLSGAIYSALNPVGLQAVVENDMLVIKVDHDAHALAGGKTARWISEDDRKVNETIEKLNQLYSGNYNQIPLEDMVMEFSSTTDIPIIIWTRSLEDIGLTRDVPVTITARDMKAIEFLNLVLAENDLTLNFKNGVLQITTEESASDSENLMIRMYWLDGIGMAEPEKTIELITTSVSPDAWDAMGGPQTIVSGDYATRKSLVVTATFDDHLRIESLLNSIRGIVPNPSTKKLQAVTKPNATAAPKSAEGAPIAIPDPFRATPPNDDPFGGTSNSNDPFGN